MPEEIIKLAETCSPLDIKSVFLGVKNSQTRKRLIVTDVISFFSLKKIKEYAIFLIYRRIRNKFIFFLIFILINFNFEYLSLFYFLPITSKVGFKVKKKNIAYDTHVHLICNFLPFEIL